MPSLRLRPVRDRMAMSLAMVSGLYPHRSTALEEDDMSATYTFDVFSSLDGYGAASANWTGYWGKQGPELLDHRLALYGAEQRMVFGANTFRAFVEMLASSTGRSTATSRSSSTDPPSIDLYGFEGDGRWRGSPRTIRRSVWLRLGFRLLPAS